VLVVGAGNSGAELALECARGGHPTWLSGRNVGQLPFRIGGRVSRLFLARLVLRGIFHRLLTLDTPLGRKARPVVISRGGPLIRVKWEDLAALGVERVPRLAGVRDGHPELEGGRVLPVANVIWCTGFHPGFSWIDLPIFDPDGEPRQRRGAVPEAPGLHFVGLHFLYAMSSTMIHGVGRDAEHVARAVEARVRAAEGAGEDVTERRPAPPAAAPPAPPARAAMPPRAGPGRPDPETRRA
jgi:putative flavoprotein involved in K+ transport